MERKYKRFEWSNEHAGSTMASIVTDMEVLLNDLADGMLPGPAFTTGDLRGYVASLVDGQVEPWTSGPWTPVFSDFANICSDSWYVGPRPIENTPAQDEVMYKLCREYGWNDFVKDFVNRPTYSAVSILMIASDSPDLIASNSGFYSSLKRGLARASKYLRVDSIRDGVEALQLLEKGNVARRVPENPDLSREMYVRLKGLASELFATSTLGRKVDRDPVRKLYQEEMRGILSCFADR